MSRLEYSRFQVQMAIQRTDSRLNSVIIFQRVEKMWYDGLDI